MKASLRVIAILFAISPLVAHGGGHPHFLKFPDGYENYLSEYATINRAHPTQGDKAASGSVVVMEIYSPKTDAEGKPIPGDDGIFEIDTLAAIAVMENRHTWLDTYPAENRTGDWGYAVYNPDGSPKENDLDCVQCHTPLKGQDYMFTHQMLIDFVKSKK